MQLPFSYSKITTITPKELDETYDEEIDGKEADIYEYADALLNKDLISLVGTDTDNFNWVQTVYIGTQENYDGEFFVVLTDDETIEWTLEPNFTISKGGADYKIQWVMTKCKVK